MKVPRREWERLGSGLRNCILKVEITQLCKPDPIAPQAGQIQFVIEQMIERMLKGAGQKLLGRTTGRNFGLVSILL